jgi:hypothetical protein
VLLLYCFDDDNLVGLEAADGNSSMCFSYSDFKDGFRMGSRPRGSSAALVCGLNTNLALGWTRELPAGYSLSSSLFTIEYRKADRIENRFSSST